MCGRLLVDDIHIIKKNTIFEHFDNPDFCNISDRFQVARRQKPALSLLQWGFSSAEAASWWSGGRPQVTLPQHLVSSHFVSFPASSRSAFLLSYSIRRHRTVIPWVETSFQLRSIPAGRHNAFISSPYFPKILYYCTVVVEASLGSIFFKRFSNGTVFMKQRIGTGYYISWPFLLLCCLPVSLLQIGKTWLNTSFRDCLVAAGRIWKR